MCHEPKNVSLTESVIQVPELDHLPLRTRRGLLESSDRVSQQVVASVAVSNVHDYVKREDICLSELAEISQSSSSQGLNDSGHLRQESNALICCSNADENFNGVEEMEETARSDDELEHLTLKERRKMLMERMVLRLPDSNLEDCTKDRDETDLHKLKAEISNESGLASSSEVQFNSFLEKVDSFLYRKTSIGLVSGNQLSLSGIQEGDIPTAHESSFEPKTSMFELTTRDYEHSASTSNAYATTAEKTSNGVKRVKRNHHLPLNVSEIQLSQVKVESLDDCVMGNNNERRPVTLKVVRDVDIIHDEAHDENELDCASLSCRLNLRTSASDPSRFVKNEAETSVELEEDEIDHMKLIDRLKLRSFRGSGHYEEELSSPKSAFNFCTSDEYVKPSRIFRSWKRKKTATDSIETALEEDAPGLLQVLVQQGVSVDELRLYGEDDVGDSDSLDDSSLEESFTELEDVISQLFIKRQTGPKLLNLKLAKGSKTSYCVTCLFSLIEQARHLRLRKWPVEWGWCRDLQSFIFVFKRHNRIVMERPEYGYATYFFELSDTASVRWQIKRLILAMKLASCSRYQLIENKPLLVGEDMTEGEAEVLMKYGWVSNTGLGTMLNYLDRVYHDRKSQKETSEWRSKIAMLLVDGYNSGTIVSSSIAHHDDAGLDAGDVKLEPFIEP